MSLVGCRGYGVLLVLGASACANGAARPALPPQVAARPAEPPRVAPPLLPAPALTPPPQGTPALRGQLDFAALLGAVTSGTDVRLEPATFAELWPTPGLDFGRPLTLARGAGDSAPMLLIVPLQPSARLELAPRDDELSARGLKLLKGTSCALREVSGSEPRAVCGPRAALLAFGGANAPPPPLATGAFAELSIDFARGITVTLDEARGDVPRSIDPLLPRDSRLPKAPEVRRALLDFGFELVERQNELLRELSPLELHLAPAARDKLTLSARLEPAAGSQAQSSIANAQLARVPAAFWELPERTDSALVFDSSLLRPWIMPGARTLQLLSEAVAAGSPVSELSAIPQACFEPGRSVVWAEGRERDLAKPAASWPPELKSLSQEPAASPQHSLLAIEDAKGACARAVTALLDGYLRSATAGTPAQGEPYLQSLPVEKPLPKSVRLFKLGAGAEASHWALASRQGTLWLARSSDLPHLKSVLAEMLAPSPQRKSLKARRDLGQFGAPAALISGFLREDALSLDTWLDANKPRYGFLRAPVDESKVARVPFSIVRDGSALRIGGQTELGSLRRAFSRLVGESFGSRELSSLPAPQQRAALSVVDAACRLGDGASCNILGVVYGDGRGVPQDMPRALKVLERGCDLQSGMACANLAFYQKAAPADELKLFQKSCDLQTALGCAWLGVKMLDQDNADKRQAFAKLQLGCDGLIGFACARIGAHYRAGVGLPQDDDKAADFHERACLLRLGEGCVELARAVQDGKGRKRNPANAFSILQHACELDKADGCYALGLAYLNGEGTSKDEAAARQQLSVACDANHAEACRMLAEMTGEP